MGRLKFSEASLELPSRIISNKNDQERHLQVSHHVRSEALLHLTSCLKLPRIWTTKYLVNRLPPYSPRCEACWTDRNQEAHVSRHHINDDRVVWTADHASPDYIEPTADKSRW